MGKLAPQLQQLLFDNILLVSIVGCWGTTSGVPVNKISPPWGQQQTLLQTSDEVLEEALDLLYQHLKGKKII